MSQAVPCMPIVTPTQRPFAQLLQVLVEPWIQLRSLVASALAQRRAKALEDHLQGLDGLSPQMLRDVGFAAWQIESAEARRAREVERWLW